MSDDTINPVSIEDGLTDQQRRGAELSAAGWSGCNIADEIGVRAETVSRWRKLPAYRAAIEAILSEAHAEISGRVVELSALALDELESLLTYRHNPSIRLRASIEMLRLAGVGRVMSSSTRSGRSGDTVAGGE